VFVLLSLFRKYAVNAPTSHAVDFVRARAISAFDVHCKFAPSWIVAEREVGVKDLVREKFDLEVTCGREIDELRRPSYYSRRELHGPRKVRGESRSSWTAVTITARYNRKPPAN
jgi:hypothetical protein